MVTLIRWLSAGLEDLQLVYNREHSTISWLGLKGNKEKGRSVDLRVKTSTRE